MTSRDKKLIDDVLSVAHLVQMPKKLSKEKTIWIEAIVKMRLANNTYGYGIAKRNADLSYRITYVNGDTYPYTEMSEIYPYVSLQKEFIHKFDKDATEKDRVEYLRSLNIPYISKLNLEEMSIDDLNKEVVKAAVYQQLKALEE